MRINQEKREEKEKVTLALLRATLRLAAAHGFSSLGLREVSRAADIAPTSFYRHFADMEELGLALIHDLGGRFVADVVERSHAAKAGPLGAFVEAMAGAALALVETDPELVRFLLAERVGAFPSFRAAVGTVLSPLGDLLETAFTAELVARGTRVPAPDLVARAAIVLLLDVCGQALDRGPGNVPALRERSATEMRMLLAGAALTASPAGVAGGTRPVEKT